MTFEDWLNETENNHSHIEKAQEELVYKRYIDNHSFWKVVIGWLRSAYLVGYKAGKNEYHKINS